MFHFLTRRQLLELDTPLPPEECIARLRQVVEERRFTWILSWGTDERKPVTGRVTPTSLQLCQRIGYRNSFQTFFTASVSPSGSGTRISGHFGMHRWVRIFMTFWFGFLLVVGGSVFTVSLGRIFSAGELPVGGALIGFIVPPGMICFGIGLVLFGRYLARDEAAFLTDFLIRTLEAREVSLPTEASTGRETHS